jgi:peptidoglycan L-alanyl-D-glutamate endopeptidase CwlK
VADHHYSQKSLGKLATAHPDLQELFEKRIGPRFPNTILEGVRSMEQQRKNVEKGVSKTMDSKHVRLPSEAVDAAPDPLEWPQIGKLLARIESVAGSLAKPERDEIMALVGEYTKSVARWYYFGGYVVGTADEVGIPVRWGGDWNGNRSIDDQSFDDLPHFELRDPRPIS